MTDFMTALPVILVQPTCPGHQRARGVQSQSTCNLCRERHKSQVWLCFLFLSLLSASTCAASGTAKVQTCLNNKRLKDAIERSDAMLYAPSSNDVEDECKMMSLRCYMLELRMVINEEEIMGPKVECILDYIERLTEANPVGCPPCETYRLDNITVFLKRLNDLLQEMNSRKT